MIVAIHQPNFFPWLGYFDKIRRADAFVFLDGAAYPKSGKSMSSYVNRVQILAQGRAEFIRCPVLRESGEQIIRDVRIDESQPWRDKLLRSLDVNYARAPFYQEYQDWIAELLAPAPNDSIADLNERAVRSLAEGLGLHTVFHRESELEIEGKSTDRLVSIIRALSGDAYICGKGAAGYQENEKFPANGIALIEQEFRHPQYEQGDAEFVPGLSVLDAIFYCGKDVVVPMLEQANTA